MTDTSRRRRVYRTLALLAAGTTSAAIAMPAAHADALSTGFAPNVERVAVDTLASSSGLTQAQALRHLQLQSSAKALAAQLTGQLGDKSAGSYLDAQTGQAVINVLDAQAADQVTAAGGVAKLVKHSSAQLASAKATLDQGTKVANTSWGIDPSTNQVKVTISKAASGSELSALLDRVHGLGDQAKITYTPGKLVTHVADGDEITTGTIICSAGFNATKGGQAVIVDAGHCTADSPDWQGIGPSLDSSFPGTDYGLIQNDSGSGPGEVNTYDGSTQPISGAGDATVGENVCKSGRTTQVTCGTVSALDQTVNYDDGAGGTQTVDGLIETNVKSDHGDSGGPLYDGSTGLGTVSGGDSTTDYFQPLPAALAAYGATLA